MQFQKPLTFPLLFLGLLLPSIASAQTVFSAAGANAADIASIVDDFRTALGNQNPNEPTNFNGGRRQINWDAAPDFISAPNLFPGDFFNFNANPRARGIEFSTDGSGFQLSATAASGAGVDFSNINSQYEDIFESFSPERLFTPLGSNITDVHFFDPANQISQTTSHGFGVVFSDVDFADTTSIELFDENDDSLGLYYAENYVGAQDEHFSFLGIAFEDSVIGRARITTGTSALGPNENLANNIDLVTIDDVIFGEPAAVPEPGSFAVLMMAGIAGIGFRRRRSA